MTRTTDPISSLRRRSARARAFSLIETLVVVILVGVLLSVVIVTVGGSRKSATGGACLSQLRQITIGLRQYAVENRQLLPDPAATGVAWTRAIQTYVGASSIYICPSDAEVAPVSGVSYDWRDTGDPATTMAGRPIDQGARMSAVLTFESLPGWHAAKRINAGRLDGSTHVMDEAACFKDLLTPVRAVTAAP
jgi:prepilin-type N-terminal cleavage/methylation domain-containing protein